jgi:FMN-dependent NADH-azoreductase
MARLLYVEASPRKQRSASIEVAKAFLGAYQKAHPGDTLQTIDVWNTEMPEFDRVALEAKYAGIEGRERSAEQKAMWSRIENSRSRSKTPTRSCSRCRCGTGAFRTN